MTKAQINSLTLKTFPNARYINFFCIDTPTYIISHGDKNNIEYKCEDYIEFEFLNRKLIWINTEVGVSGGSSATLIVPDTTDNFNPILIGKRFLSFLSSKDDHYYVELPTRGHQLNGETICVQPIFKSGSALVLKSKYLEGRNPSTFNDRYWRSLAYNREAVNSNSPYYTYLSYWKVLESACQNEMGVKNYVLQHDNLNWNSLITNRTKCAHIIGRNKRSNIFEDPDNPEIYGEINRGISKLLYLKNEVLQNYEKFFCD